MASDDKGTLFKLKVSGEHANERQSAESTRQLNNFLSKVKREIDNIDGAGSSF